MILTHTLTIIHITIITTLMTMGMITIITIMRPITRMSRTRE
jgi:hypothetical protein